MTVHSVHVDRSCILHENKITCCFSDYYFQFGFCYINPFNVDLISENCPKNCSWFVFIYKTKQLELATEKNKRKKRKRFSFRLWISNKIFVCVMFKSGAKSIKLWSFSFQNLYFLQFNVMRLFYVALLLTLGHCHEIIVRNAHANGMNSVNRMTFSNIQFDCGDGWWSENSRLANVSLGKR